MMTQEEGGSLSEVRARVGASHGITQLAHKQHFYECWAPDCDKVNLLECPPLPSLPAQPQFSYLCHGNR